MKVVTQEMLRQRKACEWHLNVFAETFGQEAEVTEANVLKAVKARLNVAWLLPHHLRLKYQKAYVPLWERYVKSRAPLWKKYEKDKDLLREEHIEGLGGRGFGEAEAQLWDKYQEACNPLWDKHEKAFVSLLTELLLKA